MALMNDKTAQSQEAYWNEDGGKRWVSHWEKTEGLFGDLTNALLSRADVKSGETVLEVGCGQGVLTRKIAERSAPGEVLGVDISGVILDVAREHAQAPNNLKFEQADAGKASLGEARFDLIMSRFGVMFFEDPIAAFVNLRSSLIGGGRMAFMCWRAVASNPWLQQPAEAAFQVLPRPEPLPAHAPGPFSLASEARLRQVLTGAGFADPELIAQDGEMLLGPVEEAVEYSAQMGPAGRALKAVGEEQKAQAISAIRECFVRNDGPRGVVFPCATWIALTEKD